MPGSDTYFLEVGGRVSMKVATDDSFTDKKLWKFGFLGFLFKAKMEECNQKDGSFSDRFGMLGQMYIFWK